MSYSIIENHIHPKHPKLRVLLTNESKNFLARTYFESRLCYKSTKSDNLDEAFRNAAKWYTDLLAGFADLPPEKTPWQPTDCNWLQRSPDKYTAFNGRLYLERRPKISKYFHARTSINGKVTEKTTHETKTGLAKKIAEKWFRQLWKASQTPLALGIGGGQHLTKNSGDLAILEEQRERISGAIYILGFVEEDTTVKRAVKIGYTSGSVEDRLRGCQTGTPKKLVILDKTIMFPVAKNYERHIQKRLRNRRLRGEWFTLTQDELDTLIQEIDTDVDLLYHGFNFWSPSTNQPYDWGILKDRVEIKERRQSYRDEEKVLLFPDPMI